MLKVKGPQRPVGPVMPMSPGSKGGGSVDMALIGDTRHPLHTKPLPRRGPGFAGSKDYDTDNDNM